MFRPKSRVERRTRALIMLLLDTGIRISEALTLERKKINLDDMLLTVSRNVLSRSRRDDLATS